MSAGAPPTVMESGRHGFPRLLTGVVTDGAWPVNGRFDISPAPVKKMVPYPPCVTVAFGTTLPLPSVKMAGADAPTWIGNPATAPLLLMPSTAGPAPTSCGTWILSWLGET